jgi:hypothetical protein
MTALERYIRLESGGRWRESEGAPWREVLVSFGNATLVLSDFSEEPLTHWSLAAVEKVAEVEGVALFAADGGTAEMVEISDPQMIEAIDEVSQMARAAARPAPRRPGLRWPVLGVLAAAALGALGWWGPGLARDYARGLVSAEQERLLSARIMGGLDAAPCTGPEGRAARVMLERRLDLRLRIMPWSQPRLARLPDGTVLLSREVVETARSAEEVAGWAALAAAGAHDSPLDRWIAEVGVPDLLRFLASAEVPEAGIARMRELLRVQTIPTDPGAVAAAGATLVRADIDPRPFAARNAAAPPALPEAPQPVFAKDRDWVALQNICG